MKSKYMCISFILHVRYLWIRYKPSPGDYTIGNRCFHVRRNSGIKTSNHKGKKKNETVCLSKSNQNFLPVNKMNIMEGLSKC